MTDGPDETDRQPIDDPSEPPAGLPPEVNPPAPPQPPAPPETPPFLYPDASAATDHEPGTLDRPPEDSERERIFVIAATQPAAAPPPAAPGQPPEPDADVLYIVPAVQPQPDLESTRLHPVSARDPGYAPRPDVAPAPVAAPAPPPAPAIAPAPAPGVTAPRRRRRPGCFAFLLVFLVLIVGGTAYAFRAGVLTPRLVLNAVGYAAAEVEFVNLRDTRIGANLALADPDGESFPAAIRLEPFDIATHRAVRPSDLTVTLLADDGQPIGACRLRLKGGDRLRIVVLPLRTLIQRGDATPASPDELFLDTSSLCR